MFEGTLLGLNLFCVPLLIGIIVFVLVKRFFSSHSN
jgi:hypothetical protein